MAFITLMMEAVRTSATSVSLHGATTQETAMFTVVVKKT
jgi:hypothetical protein